jgi:hypothetical protein
MQRRHHPDLRGDAHAAGFTLPRRIDAGSTKRGVYFPSITTLIIFKSRSRLLY